jgi:hypothetical protein
MTVRDLNFLDWYVIQKWHRESGFEYPLPNPQDESFAAMKLVLEGNQPVGAALARMTVEMYLFVEPSHGTPAMRLQILRLLHQEIEKEMRKQKIKTMHAWLPPQLAKSFGRRLKKMFGWYKPAPEWLCMAKDLQ